MKCRQCNADIADIAIFCPVCGAKQIETKGTSIVSGNIKKNNNKVLIALGVGITGILGIIIFLFNSIQKPTEQEILNAVISESDRCIEEQDYYSVVDMRFFEEGTYDCEITDEYFDKEGYYECLLEVDRYFSLVDVHEEILVGMYYDEGNKYWYPGIIESQYCENDWDITGEWTVNGDEFTLIFGECGTPSSNTGSIDIPLTVRNSYGNETYYDHTLTEISFNAIRTTNLFMNDFNFMEITPEEVLVNDYPFYKAN